MTIRSLRTVCLVSTLLAVAGQGHPAGPAGRSAEQQVLDRFLGKWHTTYRLPRTEWTPKERTGSADLTYTRAIGGQFVQERGEHSDKTTGMVMCTYDTQRKAYRGWWFASTGQTSEATGTWDARRNTFNWTYPGGAAPENTMTNYHRFTGNDTFHWKVIAKDRKGKVVFQMIGNAVRVKDSKR